MNTIAIFLDSCDLFTIDVADFIDEKPDGNNVQSFVSALRHDQKNSEQNLHFRQPLQIRYKITAEKRDPYQRALVEHETIIAKSVTENLFGRHFVPLFIHTN
jgi:hypothetical protein